MLEPKMLEIWRNFVTRHLTRINPYTGLCLAEDPMVISVNFFGEMNSGYERLMVQVHYLAPLAEREWRKWLADKYGTIAKLTRMEASQTAGKFRGRFNGALYEAQTSRR